MDLKKKYITCKHKKEHARDLERENEKLYKIRVKITDFTYLKELINMVTLFIINIGY